MDVELCVQVFVLQLVLQGVMVVEINALDNVEHLAKMAILRAIIVTLVPVQLEELLAVEPVLQTALLAMENVPVIVRVPVIQLVGKILDNVDNVQADAVLVMKDVLMYVADAATLVLEHVKQQEGILLLINHLVLPVMHIAPVVKDNVLGFVRLLVLEEKNFNNGIKRFLY